MTKLWRPIALATLTILALFATPGWGQDAGSISGKIIDAKTNHALPFANINVVGTRLGALSDSEGRYLIRNVPAGTYDLRVQFLGYDPASKTGVVVEGGQTVTADFELKEVVVTKVKEVEVTGERALVEVRQGATIRSVNAEQIRNLPVQTIDDVLQQQAGIQTESDQIHVRGGRADETIFVIDGVTNRDLVTGQSTAGQLNARSVSQVNVATGAFDVRFGNALSGVVEVRLKEGGDRFAGGFTGTTGSYGWRSFQLLTGGPDPIWKPGLRMLGLRLPGTVSTIVDVNGSLFETRFRSLGGIRNDGLLDRLFSPADRPRLRSSYEDQFIPRLNLFGWEIKNLLWFIPTGPYHYGDFFSPSQDNKWSARYGLTWKPNNVNKLTFNFQKRIAIDQGFGRSFITATGDRGEPSYPWIWNNRIDHAPTIFESNAQTSLEWRHTMSTKGYTSLQLSRYFFAQRQDVQGKLWPEYQQPDDRGTFPASDPRSGDFFIDTGDDDTWQDRRTITNSVQWNLTHRYGRHEMEVGLEHQFQTVQYITIERPWVYDPDGLGDAHDLWRVHPWVGNFYLRDRLEFEGFTANIGVRADYWFMGREVEQALADTGNTNITATTRDNFYRDTQSFFGRRYKTRISPRVIVAHPITENSSFFFNYGQFTQIPSYRYVYSKLTSVSSESFPLLGNPNLNPQVSVNYELGAKYQFREDAAINATFFQKDLYDYPAATTFRRSQGASLVDIFVYLNGHFARAKGFEIELEKRRSNYWSGKLTYTFQQTKGKSSDPNEQKIVEVGGGDASETRLSETFVSWNRPHKLTANFDIRFDGQAPERLWFLKDFGLNVFVRGSSGDAYTPINLTSTQAAEPNSENGPFQIFTDIRLSRRFHFGGRRLELSLLGTNVFNNHEIRRVDRVTGKARIWGVGQYDPINFPRIDDYTKVSQVDDPSNLGAGAEWRLQLDYDF